MLIKAENLGLLLEGGAIRSSDWEFMTNSTIKRKDGSIVLKVADDDPLEEGLP